MNCQNCGTPAKPNQMICLQCGQKLPLPKKKRSGLQIFLLMAGALLLWTIIYEGFHNYSTSENLEQENVKQSNWDGSVIQVKSWLKYHYLRDPDSYESIRWGKLEKESDGTYQIYHTFRAKNGFGGYDVESMTFTLDKEGEVISHY